MTKAVIAIYALVAIVAAAIPAGAQGDKTPPESQAVSLSTSLIGASAGPQVVTATATVIDDLSSVQDGSVRVPSFDNCRQLHRRWEYGVAKTTRAARRQVNSGHYRPHVSRAGYLANDHLDADNDLTACEVLS